jgi:hypothetical protein
MQKRKSPGTKKSTARPKTKRPGARNASAKEALGRAIAKASEPPEAVRAARGTAKKGEGAAKAAAPAKAGEKKARAPKKKEAAVGLSKQYFKSKDVCKITFRVPRPAAQEAREASVVGDFNGWRADATPMKRLKDGSFSAAMELPRGKEYRFRYLLEGGRWENDWCADRYEPGPYGGENSVVVC